MSGYFRPGAGELRNLITIGRTLARTNENGYPYGVDEAIATTYAAARDASAKEMYEAAARQIEGVINFTIRYREGIREGMWVQYRGEKLRIMQVNDRDHRRDFLTLKCCETRRTSG
ncbi:MAG: phage head closure protein [Clostridia bacterium]